MPKGKGKSKRPETPATSAGGASSSYVPTTQAEYDEMMLAFEEGMPVYAPEDENAYASTAQQQVATHHGGGSVGVAQHNSIKSNSSLELSGPMNVDGSVKSNGSISLLGDFEIRDKIEAYGNIDLQGNMTCHDKVKAFGNVKIHGNALCTGKVKVFGKLKVTGNFQVQDTIEVWGAVTIHGYLKCKNLIAYASVTTVGDESTYEVEEEETVWGAKLIKRNDYSA